MTTPRYLALLAPSYSGATLLSVMIASQSGALGFGDTYLRPSADPAEVTCTCGAAVHDCPARRAIEHEFRLSGSERFQFGDLVPFPQALYRSKVGNRLKPFHQLGANHLRWLPPWRGFLAAEAQFRRAIARGTGARVYFDGSKWLPRAELLSRTVANYAVVRLLRDPAYFVYSSMERHGSKRSPRTLMRSWVAYQVWAQEIVERLSPDRSVSVYYEDLVNDIEAVMSRIRPLLGDIDVQVDRDRLALHDCHVIGSESRLSMDRVQAPTAPPRQLRALVTAEVCSKIRGVDRYAARCTPGL